MPAWRAAGASPQVLRWVREGARCEWLSGPPPPHNHGVSCLDASPAQRAFLEDEIARCVRSGAWEPAPPSEQTHISRAKVIEKKTPSGQPQKFRVVIDLRHTNSFCKTRSCKFETLRALQRLARRGDWMLSFDLKDAYHNIGVHPQSRRYMTFSLPPAPGESTPRVMRCAALPFGWAMSPYIFTKTTRVLVRLLRSPVAPSLARLQRSAAAGRALVLRLSRRGRRSPSLSGMRLLPYVDDFLVVAASQTEALQCRERVTETLQFLGLARHEDKGWWHPTQQLEHLGLAIDTHAGLFKVPPLKLAALQRQAREVHGLATREARLVPCRLLAGFIGYAQSVHLACPPARFYLRALHDALRTRTSWDGRVRLSRQALRDLKWWSQLSSGDSAVTRAIWRPPEQATLHSDASRYGWGIHLNNSVPAHGMWLPSERSRHITYLELLAVHRGLQTFLEPLRGRSVLLWEDNTAVCHILSNMTTRSPDLMALLRRVWFLLDSANITLRVQYIKSEDNSMADSLSRGAPHDELALADSQWQRLEQRFGPHTIDRYATHANTRCRLFNARSPHPRADGLVALAQDWTGHNNYAWPPVAELPAVAQLLAENPNVSATLVTPHWPAQAWYQRLLEIASHAELWPVRAVATSPPQLHASAQHALSGATLAFFRVPARLAGA